MIMTLNIDDKTTEREKMCWWLLFRRLFYWSWLVRTSAPARSMFQYLNPKYQDKVNVQHILWFCFYGTTRSEQVFNDFNIVALCFSLSFNLKWDEMGCSVLLSRMSHFALKHVSVKTSFSLPLYCRATNSFLVDSLRSLSSMGSFVGQVIYKKINFLLIKICMSYSQVISNLNW